MLVNNNQTCKDRIVAMTLDKEFEVAVEAVKLVVSIHRHHRDMLTDKVCV